MWKRVAAAVNELDRQMPKDGEAKARPIRASSGKRVRVER
jgi:hypothetical protein